MAAQGIYQRPSGHKRREDVVITTGTGGGTTQVLDQTDVIASAPYKDGGKAEVQASPGCDFSINLVRDGQPYDRIEADNLQDLFHKMAEINPDLRAWLGAVQRE